MHNYLENRIAVNRIEYNKKSNKTFNEGTQCNFENIKMAPIVVFAYNRADRLKRLLETLESNSKINKMDLYIFVDVPLKENTRNIRYNQEVIEFLENYCVEYKKFKSIQFEVAKYHKGLAQSIISGVTKIINQYDKVIVLEDDLEVSNDFLDYMQRGLEFYRKDKNIWALTGYSPVLNIPKNYKNDVFLMPRAESLGWGTWKNRWNRCDWNVRTFDRFKKDIMAQILFNIGGNDLVRMLKLQMKNSKLDSWAIRWGYHQFLERKYTIYPIESRVIHCGNDNRSTHGPYFDKQKLKENYKTCQFNHLKINWEIIWKFKKNYDTSLMQRIKRMICEWL